MDIDDYKRIEKKRGSLCLLRVLKQTLNGEAYGHFLKVESWEIEFSFLIKWLDLEL